ncbi:MAG: hypothetical protein FWG73_03975 [Planctomycetaceae bacterium]|nr:hypothetical protein [Planctomycetaceae bacterium]
MRNIFRHITAYTIVLAMLFSIAAPFAFCQCAGCPCETSCCSLPNEKESDTRLKSPCSNNCCDIHQDNNALLTAILLLDRSNAKPVGEAVSASHGGFANTYIVSLRSDCRRASLYASVPLHLSLCVLLN